MVHWHLTFVSLAYARTVQMDLPIGWAALMLVMDGRKYRAVAAVGAGSETRADAARELIRHTARVARIGRRFS